jgi:hypothetical protein
MVQWFIQALTIAGILKNYEKFLGFGYLHVSLEQHKETKQGIHRSHLRDETLISTWDFYASHEGLGPMQAMKNSFEAIEHQIKKQKKLIIQNSALLIQDCTR